MHEDSGTTPGDMAYLTPEAKARVEIDRMLAAAPRSVEEMRQLIGAT